MSLSTVVAVKTVDDEQVAQLSTTALGHVAGLDFKSHSAETASLWLYLAFHDDDVLAQAMNGLATGDAAAQNILTIVARHDDTDNVSASPRAARGLCHFGLERPFSASCSVPFGSARSPLRHLCLADDVQDGHYTQHEPLDDT